MAANSIDMRQVFARTNTGYDNDDDDIERLLAIMAIMKGSGEFAQNIYQFLLSLEHEEREKKKFAFWEETERPFQKSQIEEEQNRINEQSRVDNLMMQFRELRQNGMASKDAAAWLKGAARGTKLTPRAINQLETFSDEEISRGLAVREAQRKEETEANFKRILKTPESFAGFIKSQIDHRMGQNLPEDQNLTRSQIAHKVYRESVDLARDIGPEFLRGDSPEEVMGKASTFLSKLEDPELMQELIPVAVSRVSNEFGMDYTPNAAEKYVKTLFGGDPRSSIEALELPLALEQRNRTTAQHQFLVKSLKDLQDQITATQSSEMGKADLQQKLLEKFLPTAAPAPGKEQGGVYQFPGTENLQINMMGNRARVPPGISEGQFQQRLGLYSGLTGEQIPEFKRVTKEVYQPKGNIDLTGPFSGGMRGIPFHYQQEKAPKEYIQFGEKEYESEQAAQEAAYQRYLDMLQKTQSGPLGELLMEKLRTTTDPYTLKPLFSSPYDLWRKPW